jgi:hypothetical protein
VFLRPDQRIFYHCDTLFTDVSKRIGEKDLEAATIKPKFKDTRFRNALGS